MKIKKQIKSNKIYNSKIGEKEMNETLKSYKNSKEVMNQKCAIYKCI